MKRVYYINEKDLEGLRHTAKLMDFGVSLMVKAAINEVVTSCAYLQERKDLFRFEVKHLATVALKESDRKEKEMLGIMKHKQFYDDYSDAIIDYAQSDITRFRIGIKSVLDKAKIADADLFSHIECARVLLDMSVMQFNCIIDDATTKFDRDYRRDFSEFCAIRLFRHWDMLCDKLYKGYNVDLNTAEVKGLFDIIYNKFTEGEYIERCFAVAYKNNPDFVKNEIEVK